MPGNHLTKSRPVALTVSLFLLMGVASALHGCSSSGFGGLSGSSESDDDEQQAPAAEVVDNKHPEDTGKPTEDSEGVPGYLVDPELIALLEREGGGWEVVGEQGAFAVDVGDGAEPADLSTYTLEALGVKAEDALRPSAEEGVTLPVETLVEIAVEADGSFSGIIDKEGVELVFLSTGDNLVDGLLKIDGIDPAKPVTVYADAVRGGGFRIPDSAIFTKGEALGLFCATGILSGETTRRMAMSRFPGSGAFVCGQCDLETELAKDHPLTGVFTEAHPCRLLPAAENDQGEEAPGFFQKTGDCSGIDSKCRLEAKATGIFAGSLDSYTFVPAKTFRDATVAAAESCKTTFGMNATLGTGTSCNGVHINLPNDPQKRSGCLFPPAKQSLTQLPLCTIGKILAGTAEEEPCDIFFEPVPGCD